MEEELLLQLENRWRKTHKVNEDTEAQTLYHENKNKTWGSNQDVWQKHLIALQFLIRPGPLGSETAQSV